jgi:hypothetical protein
MGGRERVVGASELAGELLAREAGRQVVLSAAVIIWKTGDWTREAWLDAAAETWESVFVPSSASVPSAAAVGDVGHGQPERGASAEPQTNREPEQAEPSSTPGQLAPGLDQVSAAERRVIIEALLFQAEVKGCAAPTATWPIIAKLRGEPLVGPATLTQNCERCGFPNLDEGATTHTTESGCFYAVYAYGHTSLTHRFQSLEANAIEMKKRVDELETRTAALLRIGGDR